MSMGLLLGVTVLIASGWHPFRATNRTAASVAGLRLCLMFFLLLVFWFVPTMAFDPGPRDGTDTCPSFVVDRSPAWWAEFVLLGSVLWSGVGVVKASAVSLLHHENRVGGAIAATVTAAGIAVFGLFLFAFSQLCP
jgi:hypothetical protein